MEPERSPANQGAPRHVDRAGISHGGGRDSACDVVESINGIKTANLSDNRVLTDVLKKGEVDGLLIRVRRNGEKKPLDFKVVQP